MSSLSHRPSNRSYLSAHQEQRAIAFIHVSFLGWECLIQRIIPRVRVIVVNSPGKAIKEITHILKGCNCREVYIIAHGSPGCLELGYCELSLNTLISHQSDLASWFTKDHADAPASPQLYLNGCNVAAGDGGAEFIAKLECITEATITASSQPINQGIIDLVS